MDVVLFYNLKSEPVVPSVVVTSINTPHNKHLAAQWAIIARPYHTWPQCLARHFKVRPIGQIPHRQPVGSWNDFPIKRRPDQWTMIVLPYPRCSHIQSRLKVMECITRALGKGFADMQVVIGIALWSIYHIAVSWHATFWKLKAHQCCWNTWLTDILYLNDHHS